MDYEQKYKEALERANKLHKDAITLQFEQDIKDYEYIFPELKESEDERIRKSIISGLKYLETELGWDAVGDVDILDAYDWLEKQGESYTKRDVDDAFVEKVKEYLYKQLNEGNMECGDIETFIEDFKNYIKENKV